MVNSCAACLDLVQQAKEKKWTDEEASQRTHFRQREALTEQTIVDRKVLADNNIIRIKKETRQKVKGAESEWQARATKWLATGRRKASKTIRVSRVGCSPRKYCYNIIELLHFGIFQISGPRESSSSA